MSALWLLRAAGAILLGLAALHPLMPARLRWKEELPRLSLLNRQMFLVHAYYIGLVLAMMGALCAFAPRLLVERGPLARLVCGAFAVFWFARLVVQWFVYDRSLWREGGFNAFIHWLFTAFWIYLSSLFGWLFWLQTR